jgi:Zn-dependent protease
LRNGSGDRGKSGFGLRERAFVRSPLAETGPLAQDRRSFSQRPQMSTTSVPLVPQPARRGGGSIGSGLLALAFKGIKLLKLGKVLVFGATLAGYGWLYGWRFGALLTAAILFHEWGHVRAMRLVGVEPKGIWMIPFMGGMAFMTPPETRAQEAVIALGGPLFGLGSVLAVAAIWALSGERSWAAYAAFIALVNLFNLLPIGVLDGGRLTQAVAASVHSALGIGLYGLGLVFGAVVAVRLQSWVLAAILIIALIETGGRIRRGSYGTMPRMTGMQTSIAFLAYLGLVLVFIGIIAGLAAVPGADLAAQILRD